MSGQSISVEALASELGVTVQNVRNAAQSMGDDGRYDEDSGTLSVTGADEVRNKLGTGQENEAAVRRDFSGDAVEDKDGYRQGQKGFEGNNQQKRLPGEKNKQQDKGQDSKGQDSKGQQASKPPTPAGPSGQAEKR